MGRKETYICDECQATINTSVRWVNAMTYGCSFHEKCWIEIGGPRLTRVLYLDEIRTYENGQDLGTAWEPPTPER